MSSALSDHFSHNSNRTQRNSTKLHQGGSGWGFGKDFSLECGRALEQFTQGSDDSTNARVQEAYGQQSQT